MADDICDDPIVTRFAGPRMDATRAAGTCYQINDREGRYVVLTEREAFIAARRICDDTLNRLLSQALDARASRDRQ